MVLRLAATIIVGIIVGNSLRDTKPIAVEEPNVIAFIPGVATVTPTGPIIINVWAINPRDSIIGIPVLVAPINAHIIRRGLTMVLLVRMVVAPITILILVMIAMFTGMTAAVIGMTRKKIVTTLRGGMTTIVVPATPVNGNGGIVMVVLPALVITKQIIGVMTETVVFLRTALLIAPDAKVALQDGLIATRMPVMGARLI